MCHSTTWQEEKPQHSCSSNDHENKTAARNTDVFTSLQPPENKETAAHMLTDGKMQTIELHVLQKQRQNTVSLHTAHCTVDRMRCQRNAGSVEGAEEYRVALVLATKWSGMGRNAQPCPKYTVEVKLPAI